MRALLLKDLYILKSTLRLLLAFLAMMIVVTFINKDPSFMSSYIVVLSAMLPITCIGLDERAKWDRYALAMPFSRRELVLSKYLLGLLLVVGATALTLGIIALTGTWAGQESIIQALIFPMLGLVMMAVILPLSLRFGVEKGRIMLIALVAILMGGFMAFSQTAAFEGLQRALESAFSAAWLGLGGIAVYALSAALALAVYRKKEFS